MRQFGPQLGAALAILNILLFAALLAERKPEYETLHRVEAEWRAGTAELNSADPMYLAARPFYSSAHVANVPLREDLYFAINSPAMLATFLVDSYRPRLSSADASWFMAATFAIVAGVQGFALGLAVGWIGRRRRAPYPDRSEPRAD